MLLAPIVFLVLLVLGIALARAFARIRALERTVRALELTVPHPQRAETAAVAAEVAPLPPHLPVTSDAIERSLGARWLLYVGVAAILLGVAYFEKLAIENHWIGETARVLQGAGAGGVMIAAGIVFWRRGLALYGQVIAGCGIAILYVSIFAAFSVYALIGYTAALAAMLAVTAVAAALASWQRAMALAILAAAGGYATPFLLGSPRVGEALLLYDGVLGAGAVALAARRRWRALTLVAYLCTLFSVTVWANTYFQAARYLDVEFGASVFCALFVSAALFDFLQRRREKGAITGDAIQAVLWTAPLAYYLGSLAILDGHVAALLTWIVVVMAVVAAASPGRTRAPLIVWIATMAPLAAWAGNHDAAWLASGLTAGAAIYVIAIASVVITIWPADAPRQSSSITLIYFAAAGAAEVAYLLLGPAGTGVAASIAAGLGVLQWIAAAAFYERHRDISLHFLVTGLIVAAMACAMRLDSAWVTVAWAVEATLLVALGMREERSWIRLAGMAFFAVTTVKVFVVDMAKLDRMYRVGSVIVLGVLLLATSYAYQQLRDRSE